VVRPGQGSDRVFLRPWTNLQQSRATRNRFGPLVSLGTLRWGIWANVMSILHPDRVLAAFLRSGTAAMFRPKHEFTQPEVRRQSMRFRPWSTSASEREEIFPGTALLPLSRSTEPRGSHWARSRSRSGHFCGDSRYLAIPFFDACLQMRLTEWNKILRPVDLSSAWLAAPFGDTATAAGGIQR